MIAININPIDESDIHIFINAGVIILHSPYSRSIISQY